MTRCMGKPSNVVRVSFFALSAVCQLAFACACTPAVIWCGPSFEHDDLTPPLSPKLTPDGDEFEKYLLQFNITEVIVFDDLCVEDIQNSKVLSNINGSIIFTFSCVAPNETFFNKFIKDTNDDHELNSVLKDIDSSGCIAVTGKRCRYSHAENNTGARYSAFDIIKKKIHK
ncbi:PREDICTED: uncharacterized protein LOC108772326 [Cyphomyrmex costatus]|uniref:uncharacterized protein LOC108772326 n=1 Tax=Cyphomyrmex costatus TaxID=456900 RepID=UPI00085222CF|nr:PREDICTED: uncharacterized protein LOC108772326 [Cyphomyrmex costatus]XP_018393349.1 PREDICTED: uncharacterized protein LOC108772326 [Cyphomyrmex costatus]